MEQRRRLRPARPEPSGRDKVSLPGPHISARSSTGQSIGLRIRGLGVQIPPGAPNKIKNFLTEERPRRELGLEADCRHPKVKWVADGDVWKSYY